MSYTSDWTQTARSAKERADNTVHDCGTQMTVGYSNLGVPMTVCPTCQPSLVENGKMPVGKAWGVQES